MPSNLFHDNPASAGLLSFFGRSLTPSSRGSKLVVSVGPAVILNTAISKYELKLLWAKRLGDFGHPRGGPKPLINNGKSQEQKQIEQPDPLMHVAPPFSLLVDRITRLSPISSLVSSGALDSCCSGGVAGWALNIGPNSFPSQLLPIGLAS